MISLRCWTGTPYGPALSGAYDAIKNHGTLSEFEKLCDNFMVEVLKESRFIPFGIEPVLSYLLAKKMRCRQSASSWLPRSQGSTLTKSQKG